MTPSQSVELEAAVERLREMINSRFIDDARRFRLSPDEQQAVATVLSALSASNARAEEWEAKHKNCELCLTAAISSGKEQHARALAAEEALRKAATDMRQQAEASAGNLKRFGCDAHMVDICLDHFKYQADRIDAALASMKEKDRG